MRIQRAGPEEAPTPWADLLLEPWPQQPGSVLGSKMTSAIFAVSSALATSSSGREVSRSLNTLPLLGLMSVLRFIWITSGLGTQRRVVLLGSAEARGWRDLAELKDIGHSGAKARRPALDSLQAAKAGEVRILMVYALDRLGRSPRDLLLLLDELSAAGCAVVSLREGIDLTTSAGRQVHGSIIGALASSSTPSSWSG